MTMKLAPLVVLSPIFAAIAVRGFAPSHHHSPSSTVVVVGGGCRPSSTMTTTTTIRREVVDAARGGSGRRGRRREERATTIAIAALPLEGDGDANPLEGKSGSGVSGAPPNVSNKLLAETIAPFRGLRLFFYAAFASGAFVGGLITLSGVIAASNGLRPDIVDIGAEYVNLAVDFGAVALFGALAKFDLDGGARLDAAVEERVRRKDELRKLTRDMREREMKLRDLGVSVRVSTDGDTRVAPLGVVQGSARQHVVLVIGPGRAIRDALRGAQLNKANFAMTNILVIPYEMGVDVVDRMTRPDGRGGFGVDSRPSYETQPYVAEPVGDGWEDFAIAEMNAAVEQAGEGVRDEGIALVVANDGRVLRRGVGKVPWRQMVDELEEAVTGEKKKETSVPFLEFLE